MGTPVGTAPQVLAIIALAAAPDSSVSASAPATPSPALWLAWETGIPTGTAIPTAKLRGVDRISVNLCGDVYWLEPELHDSSYSAAEGHCPDAPA